MMFEILEPCRVLRLGTSSKKYICKTNKNHDKNKNRKEKNEMEKRANEKRREQVKKKRANKEKENTVLH